MLNFTHINNSTRISQAKFRNIKYQENKIQVDGYLNNVFEHGESSSYY